MLRRAAGPVIGGELRRLTKNPPVDHLPDPVGVEVEQLADADEGERRRVVVAADPVERLARGEALLDMGYGDYGPLGRGLEWGINVHLGQQYGLANRLILALACAGIVLLCVSAAVMWWKRRPAGRLGVPPAPAEPRRLRGVLALLAIGGAIFPLVGASLIVMAVVDALVRRRTAARRAVSV